MDVLVRVVRTILEISTFFTVFWWLSVVIVALQIPYWFYAKKRWRDDSWPPAALSALDWLRSTAWSKWGIFLLAGTINGVLDEVIQTKEIGAFYETCDGYEVENWVLISKRAHDSGRQRAIGRILARTVQDDGSQGYDLASVRFANGRQVIFIPPEHEWVWEKELELGEEVSIWDKDEGDWYVELTSEKYYK